MEMTLSRAVLGGLGLLLLLTSTATSQERFHFCGGRELSRTMIRVCSRSLPDEVAPPEDMPSIPESTSTTRTTTTTSTTTTKSSLYEVDEYLTRLNLLLELMYAANELNDNEETGEPASGVSRQKGISRSRRSVAALGRYRRSYVQRAKQVARKCCNECTYQDIQSLCW